MMLGNILLEYLYFLLAAVFLCCLAAAIAATNKKANARKLLPTFVGKNIYPC
jgi:hypothetical protein